MSASHILLRNKRKQVFMNHLPTDFHCKTLKLACPLKGHLVKWNNQFHNALNPNVKTFALVVSTKVQKR